MRRKATIIAGIILQRAVAGHYMHIDGTDRHKFEFANFKRVSVIPILLDSKGITFIGMMDIKLNGAHKWFGVPVTVTIGKDFNTISITTSPKYTDNYFM
ncbi:MAG: hypothetical protein WA667_06815 [Candidatus Nitrosopolaris sp.]